MNSFRIPTVVLKKDVWQGRISLGIRRVVHREKNHARSLLSLDG